MRSSHFILAAAWALALAAHGAVNDYVRTEVKNFNGHEGVSFITWVKDTSSPGRAWAMKFDLSKGYRLRPWFGNGSGGRANVGQMAERLFDRGETPIMGMNADYFDMNTNIARCTGMLIGNSRLETKGFGSGKAPDFAYIMETGDHNLFHGKTDRSAGLTSGDPSYSWQVTANGKKIRNAVRTNYCNYPVKGGQINPVGNSSGGATFPTTIGNMQSRTQYPRPLIGIGTNGVGVATNLVLFLNDGRQAGWSNNFPDTDSAQIMIDEGCNEVGEFDGGGSATMWAENGPDSVFNFSTTTHGGIVNKPSAGALRSDACGIFVLPPSTRPYTVDVAGGNTYPDLDEALLAVAPGETVTVFAATTLAGTNVLFTSCTLASSAADPGTAPIAYSNARALTVPSGVRVCFSNVSFTASAAARTVTVAAGGVAAVAGKVGLDSIAVPNSSAFELAGALTAPLAVSCAAASAPGQAFGRSSMPLAAAQASAAMIRNAANPQISAKAAPDGNGVVLRWADDIVFGAVEGRQGYDYTNGVVTVSVAEVGAHVAAGAKLRMTVTDAAGTVLGVVDRELAGAGSYSFDTAEGVAGNAFADGYSFNCEFSLVDGTGNAVGTAQTAYGSLRLGGAAAWFSAAAADDSVAGGTWQDKPDVEEGEYQIMPDSSGSFAAAEGHGGNARLEMLFRQNGGKPESRLADLLSGFSSSPAHAAMTLGEEPDGETLLWRGLVRENGALAWKRLAGVAIPPYDAECRAAMEVDFTGGSPRVSYLAAPNASGELVRLHDGSGATWFDGPGSGTSLAGRVDISGSGAVAGFVGTVADKAVAEAGGVRYESLSAACAAGSGTVRLLTNVTWLPDVTGSWTISSEGHGLILLGGGCGPYANYSGGVLQADASRFFMPVLLEDEVGGVTNVATAVVEKSFITNHVSGAVFGTAAGLEAVNAALNAERTTGNRLPLLASYILGLDPDDSTSVPTAEIAPAAGGFTLSLGDQVSVNAAAQVPVSFSLESADNLSFRDSTATGKGTAREFQVSKDADPLRFFRIRIHIGDR